MDKYRIDSHKLIYHVDRVSEWLSGRDVYPVYMEVSPIGACNHRCTYCALDYMEYQPRKLDTDTLKTRLTEMGRLGVRSIMYAGEGEPFLHPDMNAIITHTAKSGIDAALTSNGVFFDDRVTDEGLASITWIKISINAGTPETYSKVHRTDAEDFDTVIRNIKNAVERKKRLGLKTTIGMQMILLPENAHEAETLAETARDAGADYLVIKSYSQHRMSKTKEYENVDYSEYQNLNDRLREYSTDNFNVVFRSKAMRKLTEEERAYKRCLAMPFWSYIDSGGGVWGCSAYLGDERFLFGNINDDIFEDIWKGPVRKEAMEKFSRELDTTECRKNCRMDEVNRYLWELRNPSDHVNFI